MTAKVRTLPAKHLADFAEERIAPVHTLPLLRDALENLDGWRAAADALAVVERTNLGTVSHGSDRDVVTALILEQADAGKTDPAAILDAAARATARDAAIPLAAAALVNARRRLVGDMDAAIRDAWPQLFGALADEFDAMLDRARSMKAPDQLTTAEAAERAGRTDDRATWRKITAENAAIRDAQAILLSATSLDHGIRPEALHLRDVEQTFPDWAAWVTAGGVDNPLGVRTPITAPWPLLKRRNLQRDGDLIGFDDRDLSRDDSLSVDVAKSPAFLVWVIDSGAHAWLPTPAELRAESTRLDNLAAAHSRSHVDPGEANKYRTDERPTGRTYDTTEVPA